MPKRTKPTPPTSPQAKLSGVIKTVRDTMRKDAGLNGDIDRIPQLAWLLFLKAFDGLEERREVVEGASFRLAIDEPYRWRDWAADRVDGRTGETLIDFVNSELLPYLRDLTGTGADDPRDVLAAVFKETFNRMLSGYLLRDVLNKIDEVNFASSDDIHTMAHLYESMLREMRDAAGDSGEFYTPRPVIRFMVEQVNPTLGERILDPACGTGGFLVETLEHLRPTLGSVEEVRALEGDLRGIEKKPLPYLLGMMNLLLHEVQQPHIVRANALARPVAEIRKADRVTVVLTNPPFGGEEEKAIQANFPEGTRTAETAWLFLQLVQRMLDRGGRCAIVVPNGVLFGGGVGAKIKERLLAECNLHTVVRLPQGVFAPYTTIPTNVLFFEKTGRTKEVWFYELPPPEGRKGYTKTRPLRFEEFTDCKAWWGGTPRKGRKETERAWRVPIIEIERDSYNLDLHNPNRPDDLTHRAPSELLTELMETEEEIMRILCEIEDELATRQNLTDEQRAARGWQRLPLGKIMRPAARDKAVTPNSIYRIAGIFSFGRGLIDRGTISGFDTKYRLLARLEEDDIVMSRLGGWEGAVAVVGKDFAGAYVSQEYPIFIPDRESLSPKYFSALARSPRLWDLIERSTRGSMARRKRIKPEHFLSVEIWLPPLGEQERIAYLIGMVLAIESNLEHSCNLIAALGQTVLNEAFANLA
jgi:type I restriction enzyme M protein